MTADNAGHFVGVSVSLGSQKSNSRQTQEQSVSRGSSLTSGNNLTIVAAGNGVPGADGDIRIQGSKLQSGNEILLAAERDIRLEAAANTQKLDGKNSSSGGAIGASIGAGPNGAGLSIFANANKGTGSEKGNGTTWTETTLDAGKQVSLISGRDTALKGAQVNGAKIVANVGRDLTLQSLQDSDDYKSKQTNVSAGASIAIIGSGGSASVSASQSKIDSNYRSVQEQTGLYAGKGGFQIDVGNHTQLDGSVIASTAEADKNRLSTGTLGWSSIDNKADYKSQQQSVSISSSSDGSGKFVSNMPSGMLVAYNHGDSASGTTGSAISNGSIEIRDPAKQQDVASLSRDVEHANGSISPIFDKEKEQNRLKQVQLIAEIGTQAMDIIRTQGEIEAAEEGRKELRNQGKDNPTQKELEATAAYGKVMREYGTGSDYQRAAQAVTAALQYLAGGDLGGALAGASAPYVAKLIKDQTGDNDTVRIMAQAVLGAVVASAQGNSGVAGAAGAATGELIAATLYPNKKSEELTESERQIVSSLSSLAAGMAGGLVAGDSAGAVAGAGAGKTAVENNYLGTGVNILGYQIGADQKKAFGEELQAACSGGQSQGCTDTYNKWKEKSYQQGGLENTEEREAWESLVQAAYAENVIPLCKGDLFCAMNVNARMNLDMVLYAGDAVGLKDSVEVATRATNIANDNWARLSLQAVGDITLLMTLGSMVGPLASGAKATSIEFLPKATRNSAGQIEANITQSSAIKTLESNGYRKTISQDGSVTVLTNGEKTYRFYPSSTSTGQPSASLTIEGVKKPTAKIRFSGE